MSIKSSSYLDKESGWNYEFDLRNNQVKIIPKIEISIPKNLFKFYSISKKHNVEAFKNREIYASHPFELNDLFDCSPEILDVSNVRLEVFKNLYHLAYNEKEINNKFKIDKLNGFKQFKIDFSEFYFKHLGIISLTKEIINLTMWSLYTKNKGFALEFSTEEITKQNNLLGPFPINYCNNLRKVNCNHGSAATLFQTNIKHVNWKFENEWRILAVRNDMPTYRFDRGLHHKGSQNRLFKYSNEAILSIYLGYDFFLDIYDNNRNFISFEIVNKTDELKNKLTLLNYLSTEFKKPIFIIGFNSEILKIGPIQIKINKISNLRFKVDYLY